MVSQDAQAWHIEETELQSREQNHFNLEKGK